MAGAWRSLVGGGSGRGAFAAAVAVFVASCAAVLGIEERQGRGAAADAGGDGAVGAGTSGAGAAGGVAGAEAAAGAGGTAPAGGAAGSGGTGGDPSAACRARYATALECWDCVCARCDAEVVARCATDVDCEAFRQCALMVGCTDPADCASACQVDPVLAQGLMLCAGTTCLACVEGAPCLGSATCDIPGLTAGKGLCRSGRCELCLPNGEDLLCAQALGGSGRCCPFADGAFGICCDGGTGAGGTGGMDGGGACPTQNAACWLGAAGRGLCRGGACQPCNGPVDDGYCASAYGAGYGCCGFMECCQSGGADGGSCSPTQKSCGGSCVAIDDPSWGCSAAACGPPCSLPGAVAKCDGGSCVVEVCAAAFGDCDGISANGCESTLNDPVNCGACRSPCNPANAIGTCVGGTCVRGACFGGFADCDGLASNGCERDVTTTSACGGCNVACTNAHGTTACVSGACAPACSYGFGDCDGNPGNGCETGLSSPQNCGVCGRICAAPNAVASCPSDQCVVASCSPGRSDANGAFSDGCEAVCTATGAETCNGVDDDCNGFVDDGFAPVACEGPGMAGFAFGGASRCRRGTRPCGGGPCVGWVGPAAELCNGLDDDCDGTIDEDVPGTSQTCGATLAPCSPGMTACVGGALVCVGASGPQPEVCNGVDDDCDGAPDDGASCPGVTVCVAGACR